MENWEIELGKRLHAYAETAGKESAHNLTQRWSLVEAGLEERREKKYLFIWWGAAAIFMTILGTWFFTKPQQSASAGAGMSKSHHAIQEPVPTNGNTILKSGEGQTENLFSQHNNVKSTDSVTPSVQNLSPLTMPIVSILHEDSAKTGLPKTKEKTSRKQRNARLVIVLPRNETGRAAKENTRTGNVIDFSEKGRHTAAERGDKNTVIKF